MNAPEQPQQPTIAIVGGSLVGPACELFLRQAGFTDITTFEALPAAHSQSGGIMGLKPDVLDLLARIGIPARSVSALRDFHTYTYDLDGERITSRDSSVVPGVVASWQSMHDALRSLVDVKTRKRLTNVSTVGRGWRLTFKDGTEEYADLLIGADGRGSFLRDQLCPDRPAEYNGYTVWRGLGEPLAQPPTRGWERYFDIRHGRMLAVTEPTLQSGRSYWELIANTTAAEYEAVAGAHPLRKGFMLPGTGEPVALAEVVGRAAHRLPGRFREMIFGSDIAGIPVNDVRMADRAVFTRGRSHALLVGDALQTIRSQAGAGLNQGLMQVAELAQALRYGRGRFAGLPAWERRTLARLGPVIELGRARAHRNNLGTYTPVRPGFTAAPVGRDQWAAPRWVSA